MGTSEGAPGESTAGPRPLSRTLSAPDRAALEAIGDPVALGVLTVLSEREHDVRSVVAETGLPQSSVYRKLRELTVQGLVGVDRFAFTADGHKVELFRTRVRKVAVEFAAGRLRVEVDRTEDAADRLGRMWGDVRSFGR